MTQVSQKPKRTYKTLEERIDEIRPYAEAGLTLDKISEITGISRTYCSTVLAAGRAANIISRPSKKFNNIFNIPLGGFTGLVMTMDPPFRKWVLDNIPADVTLAEFAFACMRDAYHEETEP